MKKETIAQQKDRLQAGLERLGIYYPPRELDFIFRMCQLRPGYSHPYRLDLGKGPIAVNVRFSAERQTEVCGYDWTFFQVPDYNKEVVNGFSVRKLEARIRSCSWRLQQQTFSELPAIYSDLLKLARCGPEGKTAAEALQLKYFLGTPAEQYINLAAVKQQHARFFYCNLEDKGADLRVGEVALLTSGAPVFKPDDPQSPDLLRGCWVGLSPVSTAQGLLYVKKTYPAFDLAAQVGQLQLEEADSIRLIGSLCHGLRWPVKQEAAGETRIFRISVDPGGQTIVLEDDQNVPQSLQAFYLPDKAGEGQKMSTASRKSRRLKKRKGL